MQDRRIFLRVLCCWLVVLVQALILTMCNSTEITRATSSNMLATQKISGDVDSSSRESLVMFALEKYWTPNTAYGTGGFCSSGGMNHAKHLLSSFLGIASTVSSTRRAVIVRPAYIFAKTHGEIPESTLWSDMFPWHVDSDEFKSPQDIWTALAAEPERFEVFDVYHKPHSLVKRLAKSKAEIALLHMYGVKNHGNQTRVSCASYAPFTTIEHSYSKKDLQPKIVHPDFAPPSAVIANCAELIIDRLKRIDSIGEYSTLHVRRGDAIRHGVNGGGGYLGYGLVQLMLVTSPAFVSEALKDRALQKRPVVLFTNEANRSMYDNLRQDFNIFTEDDLIAMLSEQQQSSVSNPYSRYLLLIEIAKASKEHICTVAQRLGTKCTSTLISRLPKGCKVENCPVICRQDGDCESAPSSKKERYEYLQSLDWKHDSSLKLQTKQLKKYFEKDSG